MSNQATDQPLRPNRFARHPKTTVAVIVVGFFALLELCCYLVIVFLGHRELRFQYRDNRIISGYTVFQNVPHRSYQTSAIRTEPSEPVPVLDEYGFLSDGPVSREKPKGTFRIFLVGGSTAFGAGQNSRYHAVHQYPDGLYCYPSSIAGRLKADLQRRDPGKRYEVINAAGFERRIHQSFIQYLETLTRFEPDLIVNLEGMNDVYSIVSGTPFEDLESQLPTYVELYSQRHSLLNYWSTYYVLSTAYEKWINRRRSAEPAPVPPPSHGDGGGSAGAGTAAGRERAAGDAGREVYAKEESRYRRNAERVLQILRQYFAVLQTDKTRCLFVLQPLLHRRKVNKHLSETEQKFAGVLVPANAGANKRFDENGLVLTYFYDDYLSAAIKETAARFGVDYIDMNAEIAGLGPDVEFFTDYCHLTPEGNRRVAEILARGIVPAAAPSKPH